MEKAPIDNLFIIPGEVIYGSILPHLKLNELLRLRRVCKKLQTQSNDYIRNLVDGQEQEINSTNRTFLDFLNFYVPTSTTKIYMNNSGPEFFEDPNIPEFLRLYASKITHVRIKHFQTCISEPENNFFSALTNLQHLDLEYTDARERNLASKKVNGVIIRPDACYFPENFKNLTTLKLGQIKASKITDHNYAWDIIEFCENVEFLQHPVIDYHIRDGSRTRVSYKDQEGPFACVTDNMRGRAAQGLPISLKCIDLRNHVEQKFDHLSYGMLVITCHEQNVKLLNVDGEVHSINNYKYFNSFDKIAEPLISANNLNFGMLCSEFKNLEKLVIPSTAECHFGEFWKIKEQEMPRWPKLNTLDITIDSFGTGNDTDHSVVAVPIIELFCFLFGLVRRKALRDLTLRFDQARTKRWAPNLNLLPCVKAVDITRTCENLTKLTLVNWVGTNKALSIFWSGLTKLEEVVLDECKRLGDVAFVGKNKEEPSFLKLTKLQKFTLKGLDSMPITDLIFNLVFRHLKIKEFCLTSNEPIKSITIDGIRSLLDGNFKQHVERFPFQGWSLENVTMEEFLQLKCQFRASHML